MHDGQVNSADSQSWKTDLFTRFYGVSNLDEGLIPEVLKKLVVSIGYEIRRRGIGDQYLARFSGRWGAEDTIKELGQEFFLTELWDANQIVFYQSQVKQGFEIDPLIHKKVGRLIQNLQSGASWGLTRIYKFLHETLGELVKEHPDRFFDTHKKKKAHQKTRIIRFGNESSASPVDSELLISSLSKAGDWEEIAVQLLQGGKWKPLVKEFKAVLLKLEKSGVKAFRFKDLEGAFQSQWNQIGFEKHLEKNREEDRKREIDEENRTKQDRKPYQNDGDQKESQKNQREAFGRLRKAIRDAKVRDKRKARMLKITTFIQDVLKREKQGSGPSSLEEIAIKLNVGNTTIYDDCAQIRKIAEKADLFLPDFRGVLDEVQKRSWSIPRGKTKG